MWWLQIPDHGAMRHKNIDMTVVVENPPKPLRVDHLGQD